MKFYMELVLVALLLVLIHEKPPPLVAFAGTALGKGVLVVSGVLIAQRFGLGAGILVSIAIILLLESKHEGLGTGGSPKVRDERKKLEVADQAVRGSKKSPSSKKCSVDSDCGSCESSCSEGKCGLGGPGVSETTKRSCSSNKDCGACSGKCGPDGTCVMSFIDQISLDRQLKSNALTAAMTASKQSNDQTSNGTPGEKENFGNYL